MSLLTIVQGAALRCGLNQTVTSAYSSTDPEIQQLVAFATDTGVDLYKREGWRNIKLEAETIGDGHSTLFNLPADWHRMCPTTRSPVGALISLARPTIPLYGPINDEDLNQLKALPAYVAYPVWRLVWGQLEIWPAIANGEVVKFWYFSSNWILNEDGVTRQGAWTADNNTSLIDEDCIMKGTIWRWKAAKGLDYAEAFRDYERAVDMSNGQEDTERVTATSTNVVNLDNFWPGIISYTS